ncbi:MAG: peptidyl-prolyl cis-trans isomerase [Methyloprofundus sp.]|nr:peptidyl-prolyl cis-trans isomerase [Methyloprofundus sp.]
MRPLILFLMLSLTSSYSFSTENKTSTPQTKVKLQTTLGDIVIELNSQKAPVTVSNFLKYVETGFYNGTTFHRIIPGFMAQGGGFDVNFQKKSTLNPIKNESNNGLKNNRGTISMARTGNPDSATAQFFINYTDNNSLNYPAQRGSGYAVFGKVIEGMDIVDQMAKVPTGNHGRFQNVPKTAIVIEKALLLTQ